MANIMPFNEINKIFVPAKPGLYAFYDQFGNLIYVGKTDVSLNRRLWQHTYKDENPLLGYYISLGVSFEYLVVENFQLLKNLEEDLIRKYRPICNRKVPSPVTFSSRIQKGV
jgi:excinuclease UvrABC nuclease subunit